MKYRRLGRTNLHVSVIGVGSWQFGGEWGKDYTQSEVDAVISAARDHGINLIDTAECYGDHLSERLVGQAVKGERDRWIIATKFGHHYNDRFDRDQLWSVSDVLKQLEDSLRALQTDYIDLYQFHSGDDAAFDNDELWTMLQKQVEAGKVRNLGISIASIISVHQAESALKVGAGALQVVYNRIDRQPEEAVFPAALRDDLGVLARVPLASGFLSGKYRPGATFDKTDVRSRREREQVESALREVQEIERTELPDGVDMAAWALAWCLRHPAVSCVIPGCKNPGQVAANASAVDLVVDGHAQEIAG
ncbi:MAG: aldo/keto reductase [Spirochaetia bacterium]|jgi:aryl-alcohol dehydrogenase-like predicted oxidoreductase|nr:aldo/keto reductase [Spirochaetia bacterium]